MPSRFEAAGGHECRDSRDRRRWLGLLVSTMVVFAGGTARPRPRTKRIPRAPPSARPRAPTGRPASARSAWIRRRAPPRARGPRRRRPARPRRPSPPTFPTNPPPPPPPGQPAARCRTRQRAAARLLLSAAAAARLLLSAAARATRRPGYYPPPYAAMRPPRPPRQKRGFLAMPYVGMHSFQHQEASAFGPGLRVGTFIGGRINDICSLNAELIVGYRQRARRPGGHRLRRVLRRRRVQPPVPASRRVGRSS